MQFPLPETDPGTDPAPPDIVVVVLDRAAFEEDADWLEAAVALLARGNAGNVQLTDGGGI